MYGSSFMMATDNPRLLKRRPSDATVMPLPTDETTPPVTNRNFGILHCSLARYSRRTHSHGYQHDVTHDDLKNGLECCAIIPSGVCLLQVVTGNRSPENSNRPIERGASISVFGAGPSSLVILPGSSERLPAVLPGDWQG